MSETDLAPSGTLAIPKAIPILTYHQIAPAPPKGTGYRSLCVAPDDFAAHMSLLRALGYQGLCMRELLPYLRGDKQGKVVGITFDDGYCNNLEHAAPVLRAQGFSATCYAVSNMLGQTNAWDADNGVPAYPLMTAAQLREWVACGQEVGAHTRHHAHLGMLDPAQSLDEIVGCKTELEQHLGVAVQHFCYPYGQYGETHVRQVAQAGYLTATTTQRGRCASGDRLLQLPRVPVLRRTGRTLLWWKLSSGYEDRRRG